jgi:hypothetical protein
MFILWRRVLSSQYHLPIRYPNEKGGQKILQFHGDSFDVQVHLHGPYRWVGQGEDVFFQRPEAHGRGVYLWTVPFKDGFLCYYVGETGRSFHKRFTEHARDCVSGLYRIYDPKQFAHGRKTLVWEGMWKPGTRERMGQFLDLLPELAPVISAFLRLFQMFLIPFSGEQRVRQRLEAAIADQLNQQPGIVGTFQNYDIRYRHRRGDEEPVRVRVGGHAAVHGLGRELVT